MVNGGLISSDIKRWRTWLHSFELHRDAINADDLIVYLDSHVAKIVK